MNLKAGLVRPLLELRKQERISVVQYEQLYAFLDHERLGLARDLYPSDTYRRRASRGARDSGQSPDYDPSLMDRLVQRLVWIRSRSASETKNGEPRHRRRRNLLVLLASVGAVGVVAAALTYSHWNPRQRNGTTASAETRATPEGATKCLTARRALVTPMTGGRDFPTARAIRASFALLPTRPLDSAILYFEPDRATAQRELAALAARQKGNVSSSLFNRYFQTKNNVVVFWENPKAAAASRSAVFGCLS